MVVALSLVCVPGCNNDSEGGLACTLEPGRDVGYEIGGDVATHAVVQAIMDHAVVASALTLRTIAACAELAHRSGVAQRDIDSALAKPVIDDQVVAVCMLSQGGHGAAGGTCKAPVSAGCGVACDAAAQAKAECTGSSELAAVRAQLVLMEPSNAALRASVGRFSNLTTACENVPKESVARSTAHVTAARQALDYLQ